MEKEHHQHHTSNYDRFMSGGQRSAVGRNFLCQCGKHIFIGDKSVINDNCTMMDENHIRIGNQVLIAPNVQFYTATHPIDYNERFVENWDENSGELFFRTQSLPITVEDNVWIGGGSIILAGITIGTGSVIGAGSCRHNNRNRKCDWCRKCRDKNQSRQIV